MARMRSQQGMRTGGSRAPSTPRRVVAAGHACTRFSSPLSVTRRLHIASASTSSVDGSFPRLSSAAAHRSSSESMGHVSLIKASELAALLESPSPPLLLEAAVAGATPAQAFIPHATTFCLSEVDVYDEDARGLPTRVSGNYCLRPFDELRRALEAAGIVFNRQVVLYTQAEKAGGLDLAVAARLAWCLSLSGVQHVALFADGLAAWTKEGHAVVTETVPPVSVPDFFCGEDLPFPSHPEYASDTKEVAAASGGRSELQLADVRSWREFTGGGHDYPFSMPRGRIPNARWAHWGPSTCERPLRHLLPCLPPARTLARAPTPSLPLG